jgi:hypothetical protein
MGSIRAWEGLEQIAMGDEMTGGLSTGCGYRRSPRMTIYINGSGECTTIYMDADPMRTCRRDFFPDVPKMKSQLEWMQALRSGDRERIRQAQISIAHRRAGLKTPMLGGGGGAFRQPGATPDGGLGDTPSGRPGTSGWSTPGTAPRTLSTPAMTPLAHAPDATPSGAAAAAAAACPAAALCAGGAQLRAPPMGLDSYLAQHTSEDNASFSKVVGEEQKKKRIKVGASWVLAQRLPAFSVPVCLPANKLINTPWGVNEGSLPVMCPASLRGECQRFPGVRKHSLVRAVSDAAASTAAAHFLCEGPTPLPHPLDAPPPRSTHTTWTTRTGRCC